LKEKCKMMQRERTLIYKKAIKIISFIIGTISIALGILGMFLPLLPTTPFLLLAAICYARSSQRFYLALITNRWCGSYIRNYREGRGIPLKQKILTVILLWLSIGYTIIFILAEIWLKFIFLFIAGAVTIHIIRLKTYKMEKQMCKSDTNYIVLKKSIEMRT